MNSTTVAEIMRELGVGKSTAYTLRKKATAEALAGGAPESTQQQILDVLKNGPVRDVQELHEALAFKGHHHSASDITRSIWSLQKRNLVTFYERKTGGGDSLLTKIKLTRNGMAELGLTKHDETKPPFVKPTRELKRRSPVGTDYTDAKNHGNKATGDGIEVTGRVSPRVPQVIPNVPYVAPRDPAPTPTRYAAPEPLHQNEKRLIVETKRNLGEFPLIAAILGRVDQMAAYEAAAKALEGIDDETALDLLGKVTLTDLEKEIVRYVRG